MTSPLTIQQEQLIMMLPETEFGMALFSWIRSELEALEKEEELTARISDNPIKDDFRCKLGQKIALRKILRKPQELKINRSRQKE